MEARKKAVIPPTIPKNFVELLENGEVINVAPEMGKALVKSNSDIYKWPKGGKPKAEKDAVKKITKEHAGPSTEKPEITGANKPEEKPVIPPDGKPEDHKSDGKFTLDDVLALPHKEKIALAKKLNVSAAGKGKDIAARIMEAAS